MTTMPEPKVRFRQDDGSSYPAWKTIPMSEVFTEISEKNHPEMPVLSVQQGVGTVLRDSSDRNILYDKANLKNYKAMKKDDYIIHLRSFEGGLECSNYDGISSPAYRILRPQAILSDAYRDYFRSYEFIHNKLAVSVVGIRDGKNIDMDTFWEIPMEIPCLEEQQKIADFLSSVNVIIAASEEEVANLETQKKAVMKKIFSQEVRFKRADGSDFPEWEKVRFWDAVSLNSSLVDPKEEPYCHMLHVGAANIEKSTGILLPCMTASEEGITSGKYLFDETCVVYSKIRPELSKATIPGFTGLCSADAYPLKPRADILPRIILMQILSDKFVKFATSTSARTKMPKINQEELGEYVFAIPCFEEQCLIAGFLSDFDEAIAAAKKELELWKELKKGLLQQMFV